MSQSQAHTDIMTVVKQIQQAHTAYPLYVQADNGAPPDAAQQERPYLKVEIDFLPGGGQMDMADSPTIKQVGQLCLYAVVRAGAGSVAARQLLDFVTPYFDLAQIGTVNTHAMLATRAVTREGLEHFPAFTDFWYFRRK